MANVMLSSVNNPSDPRFAETDLAEIKGLQDRGIYVVVDEDSVPPGATVLTPELSTLISSTANAGRSTGLA